MEAYDLSVAEDFLANLTDEIGEEEACRIEGTAQELINKTLNLSINGHHGLLFGQIQSGKTNNIIMAISKASDRLIRLFIVLTSDNLWLYNQTCRAIVKSGV